MVPVACACPAVCVQVLDFCPGRLLTPGWTGSDLGTEGFAGSARCHPPRCPHRTRCSSSGSTGRCTGGPSSSCSSGKTTSGGWAREVPPVLPVPLGLVARGRCEGHSVGGGLFLILHSRAHHACLLLSLGAAGSTPSWTCWRPSRRAWSGA